MLDVVAFFIVHIVPKCFLWCVDFYIINSMNMENFIFGYGSLINTESRARTGHSGEALPCVVEGIERQWNLVVSQMNATAVGAIFNPEALCNGVIVPVPEAELPKFDEREIGYTRIRLNIGGIRPINNQEVPKGEIWAYVANHPGTPSEKAPLVQSYIDVIMSACFDYGENFARDFVLQTTGWNNPWINDRSHPRYPRFMEQVPLASKIDNLLLELVPDAFHSRKELP